ncbi:nicotinamide mononucleotide transporter [Candidatus Francisella endociliophora]|uniref:Nicotinamide riboside transporter PnuC n=1 Tax=Candidatus Francisella endociliophora TaxID=653937 RepID=A0A097ERJ1_9GAMM|nr:nicotinamide riboside transporter PnuC [Francisella sp. FSC1006]AIT10179.1 nicotinamide mononucleotide transporter [Francisella sp. FSC1006]
MNIFKNFISQLTTYFKGFRNIRLTNIFNGWSTLEIVWFVTATLTMLFISAYTAQQQVVLTIVATVTGITTILLIAKGKVLNFFFGLINNLTYAYVCYSQGIYGQFLLFLCFYFPMQFYGMHTWTKPQRTNENNDIITRVLTGSQRLKLSVGIIVVATLYGLIILKGVFNQQVGLFADSLTGVVAVVAIILMVNAYIEQWVLWIIINSLSTIIWLQQYLFGTGQGIAFLVMWLIYLCNAIYGYINWLKLKKDD